MNLNRVTFSLSKYSGYVYNSLKRKFVEVDYWETIIFLSFSTVGEKQSELAENKNIDIKNILKSVLGSKQKKNENIHFRFSLDRKSRRSHKKECNTNISHLYKPL